MIDNQTRMTACFLWFIAAALLGTTAPVSSSSSNFEPTQWTQGFKKVLVIRIRYPDFPNVDPITENEINTSYDLAKQQLPEFSYGTLTLDPTIVITPTITLPHPSTFYTGVWFEEMAADARSAAAALNPLYDTKNYDFDVIISNTPGSTASGQGLICSKGIHFTGGPGIIQGLAHEIGHNLGLGHASYGKYGNATFGPLHNDSTLVEIGDNHDLMGTTQLTGGSPKYHFNPIEKHVLGWLTDDSIETASSSNTYLIYAFDSGTITPGHKYALRVPHSPQEDVWYSFRQKWVDNPWSTDGVEMYMWNPYIHYYGFANEANSIKLDSTPGTPGGVDDGALLIGKTFYDAYGDVYVTPTGKSGSVPESVDLVVNFGPIVPANSAPSASVNVIPGTSVPIGSSVTLTATATDPNGDTLAYLWDFGDGSFSAANNPQATKSWGVAGKYLVSCVVSDMKGGEKRVTVIITVGNPTVNSISGIVRDAAGNPMAGVHVHNGLNAPGSLTYRGTYTKNDGSYTITNLPTGSYTVTAGKDQSVFTRDGGWTNPVSVGIPGPPEITQDIVGKDFKRTGGLVIISGSVRSGPLGALTPNITVRVLKSDGVTVDVVSNGSGVWQLNVPQGITTATAIPPAGSGWTSGAAYPNYGGAFPNPWTINVGGTAISNLFFYFRTPALPVVGFQSATSSVLENANEATIPVSVTRDAGTALYMDYKINSASTATGSGVDHFMANRQFIFPAIPAGNPPGNMILQTYNIKIPIINDTLSESNETVVIDLVATQVTYQPAIVRHTLTIINATPGRVANGNGPGAPLTIRKNSIDASKLDFSWGPSCGNDVAQYALYQGTIGNWSSHLPLQCATGGVSANGVTPDDGLVYFLIVPRSASAEGSYGTRSGGAEIPQSLLPCTLPQNLGACP